MEHIGQETTDANMCPGVPGCAPCSVHIAGPPEESKKTVHLQTCPQIALEVKDLKEPGWGGEEAAYLQSFPFLPGRTVR
ncbi:hypothetical protein E2C01_033281 [Portunus trituberculatus]|uniref:Uncharacterized protein n=1 Tax=Portunus trituberculatus TaxID=210409 RepID=A0A5B7F3S5_PORTR|nr:hypothetical protein [Portunus trituberculatus]